MFKNFKYINNNSNFYYLTDVDMQYFPSISEILLRLAETDVTYVKTKTKCKRELLSLKFIRAQLKNSEIWAV